MSSPEEVVAAARTKSRRNRAIAAGVVLAAIAVLAWVFHPLRGLPDIGDPFDAEELRAMAVPEEENAFALYRAVKASPLPAGMTDIPVRWEEAGGAVRAWADANRPALETWRAGSARPDALYNHPTSLRFDTLLPVTQDLRTFARLALLEASRREAEGDMAGAWGWYRAILRSGVHSGRNGGMVERMMGNAMIESAAGPIERWAADPRVDEALLARALAEAKEARGMARPWSHTLKLEYLLVDQSLSEPGFATDHQFMASMGRPRIILFTIAGRSFSWDDLRRSGPALRMKGEPDVSRRLARLAYANWIAGIDLPRDRRPEIVAGPIPFFRHRPDAPGPARRMAPEEIQRRLHSRTLASLLLPAVQRTFLPAADQQPALADAEEAHWARIERSLGPKSGPPAP